MTEPTQARVRAAANRTRVFTVFKYGVYALLVLNAFLFLIEESAGFAVAFVGGATLGDVIQAFRTTIDTAAWLVLLLLFELETSVLSTAWVDAHKKALHGVRTVSFVFVLWAFYGYCSSAVFVMDTVPIDATNLCDFADRGRSFLVDLREYVPIDSSNCATLAATPELAVLGDSMIMADAAALEAVRPFAWADVINAGTWVLVVLLLELDVRLKEGGKYSGVVFRLSYAAKFVLYSVLFLAAVYWGVSGVWLDFWDAFLWLLAFVFIELNVLGTLDQQRDNYWRSSGLRTTAERRSLVNRPQW